ncbi:MAG: hypothetical protein AAB797_03195 [Patescibacteria group bacterium]
MSTNKPGKLPIPIAYKGRYGFWRLLNIVVLGLLVSGSMFTYYFIYQNIYSAIANANSIIALQSNLNIYDLDLQAYEKAEAAITQKKRLEEFPLNIRNIFYYNTGTSTYANTKP